MKWLWEILEAELSATASLALANFSDSIHNVSDELDRDLQLVTDSGSAMAVLTTSAVLVVQEPQLAINSGQSPTVVQVIFQVSDTAASPYNDDEEAIKNALAFVAEHKHTSIELDVKKDLTQYLATITANIFTDSPVEVSVAFIKADRNGLFAASMSGAELEYLEVSMTATVTYAGHGFIDAGAVAGMPFFEAEEAGGSAALKVEASKDSTVVVVIASLSGAVILFCILGCIYLRIKLLKSGSNSPSPPISLATPAKATIADLPGVDSSVQMTACQM
jgi:hypothetical protein